MKYIELNWWFCKCQLTGYTSTPQTWSFFIYHWLFKTLIIGPLDHLIIFHLFPITLYKYNQSNVFKNTTLKTHLQNDQPKKIWTPNLECYLNTNSSLFFRRYSIPRHCRKELLTISFTFGIYEN